MNLLNVSLSLLTLETARRRVRGLRGTLGIRAVIKHSPRHNGSLPTHALTLGELAHNITPAGNQEEESWSKSRDMGF